MEDLKIGVADIVYSETGEVLRAFFTPKIHVGNVTPQLKKLKPGNPAIMKQNAEILLSSWFNKSNEIELADREHYKIESEILLCSYYQDGGVRRCRIEFTFKEIKNPVI